MMNTLNSSDVCVVTVTYDNRFHLLCQVVEAVLNAGVGKVIIVDNASVPESGQRLRELELTSEG